jgi:hypothetical protein
MQHAWEEGEKRSNLWSKNMKERDRTEDLKAS